MELFVDNTSASTLARIVAVATKAEVTIVEADSDKFKAANHSKIPALAIAGKVVAGAIEVSKELIAAQKATALLGNDAKEQKEVEEGVAYAFGELQNAVTAEDKKRGLPILHKLNKTIQAVTYYASNHLTLADLAVLSIVQPALVSWTEQERVGFVNICRYYDLIQHQVGFHGKLDKFVLTFVLDVPKQEKKADEPAEKKEAPAKKAGGEKKEKPAAGEAGAKKAAAGAGEKKEQQPKKEAPAKQPKQQPAKKEEELPVDITRVDLRVGKIVHCERHPNAEKLYVEQIDLGEEKPRTIVSGLVNFVPLEQMQNRLVVVVCNLKPAKLVGIESAGMVLAASNEDHTKVEVLDPPAGAKAGEPITFAGYTGKPDEQLNPKKKIFEAVKPDLLTNADCVGCYKGIPFMTSAGPCKVATLANSHLG